MRTLFPSGTQRGSENPETVGLEDLHLSRPGRIRNEARIGGGALYRQCPLPVQRQVPGSALAQPYGRRAVRLPYVDGVPGASSLPGLGEEDRPAVGGDGGAERPVEPGHVALLRLARSQADHLGTKRVARDEHAAFPRDVLEREAPRHPGAKRRLPRKGGHVESAVAANLRRREPDPPVGAPREPLRRRKRLRDGPLLPGAVDHGDRPAVVPGRGMVVEGHELAVGRNAQVTDPSARLVNGLADRVLDSALSGSSERDREGLAVGRPVRPFHPFEDLAWRRAPRDGDLRERSLAPEPTRRISG